MIIKKLFGADMIVGTHLDINPAFAYRLAGALVKIFQRKNLSFVVGCDTRIESKTLAQAMVDGLTKCGAEVFFVGKTTCGGISYGTKYFRASAGVLVTGSDKFFIYNGFKIFNGNGFKISDEQMSAVQFSFLHDEFSYDLFGRANYVDNYNQFYAKYLSSFVEKRTNLLLDLAHGSGIEVGKYLEKYTDICCYNDTSNGYDINYNCGINNFLYKSNTWNIKFDGDCDRLVVISPNGKVLKGDRLLSIFAVTENENIVTNLFTNNACFDFLDNKKIKYCLAENGERRLVDTMLKKGYNLCGEQSGNIIWLETKTSDAFVTALKFANLVDDDIVNEVLNLPYVPSNDLKFSLDYEKINSAKFQTIISETERELENCGKIIVRINHLENQVCIYIECTDKQYLQDISKRISEYLK